MAHGISEQDWLRFIDGNLDAAARRRLEDHIASCPDCTAEAGELRHWHVLLRDEGYRLSEALRMEESHVETLLERSLERMRQVAPMGVRRAWSVRDGLTILRFVMDPICGSGATRAAINLAILRSAGAGRDLTGTNWGLFVGNLREATSLICGQAAGRLVFRAGSCLSIAA